MRSNPKLFFICVISFNFAVFLGCTFMKANSGQFVLQPGTTRSTAKSSNGRLKMFYHNKTRAFRHVPEEKVFSKNNFPAQKFKTQPKLHTTSAPCPNGPIVSGVDGGRLGNKVWEYAAVWALSRHLGRPGFVPQTLLTSLNKIFANLTLRAIEDIGHCGVQLGEPVKKWRLLALDKLKHRFRGRSLLLQPYILLPHPVRLFRGSLHEEFWIRPDLQREVDATIEAVGGRGRVLVGVHVRRTDFAQFLPKYFNTGLLADGAFFKKAMQWFRENVAGALLFLIVSDDLEWCRKFLLDSDDVVIASKSAAHDFALLSSSDHTIVDYGTFGYWGALMAGGHTISLNADKYFNEEIAKGNDKWHVFQTEHFKTE